MSNYLKICQYDSCFEDEQHADSALYEPNFYQNEEYNNQNEQEEELPPTQFDESMNVSTSILPRRFKTQQIRRLMSNYLKICQYDSCFEDEQHADSAFYEPNSYQNEEYNNQNEQEEELPPTQFDESMNVSTSILPRRCEVQRQESVVQERTAEQSSKPSNNTKNFPSQMGRLIINHLKKNKKASKLSLKVPKNLGGVNKLTKNEQIRSDVVEFFEGNHILFQVLSSPKILNVSNVIQAFAPYHQAFKLNRELENQTW